MFHVGQKVEFVTYKVPWYWGWATKEPPQGYFSFGRPYTVAAIEKRVFGIFTLLHFSDAANHPDRIGLIPVYPGWLSFHFRPIVDTKASAGMATIKKVADTASATRRITVSQAN